MQHTDPEIPATGPASAWAPLAQREFRLLWLVWIIAHTCLWMHDVAAAWLMASLATTPLLVALVNSASILPVFLFGLPIGTLADRVDRRRMLIATQYWSVTVAATFGCVVWSGALTPPLLLALTFANGIALALRLPVYAALVAEVVPGPSLLSALALNNVAFNLSRIIGPVIAGLVIAALGAEWAFALVVVLLAFAIALLRGWERETASRARPHEPFLEAMLTGLRFVRGSDRARAVITRSATFFACSVAQVALLPLVARDLLGGDARTYTLLLAAMGLGAVIGFVALPRLRLAASPNRLVLFGVVLQGSAMAALAHAPDLPGAALAMLVGGAAWIAVVSSLVATAQMAFPQWVKARGMGIYQMNMTGSVALGGAIWGQVATTTSLESALVGAGACAVAGALWSANRHLGEWA